MVLAIVMTAVIVGVIAYGMGKLSVYVQHDIERDLTGHADVSVILDSRQYELWDKAQENATAAERELAKLVATLSLAGIAGVAALAQLKIFGSTGVIVLTLGFFFPTMFCIANLQMRQALSHERVRRLQDAFERGEPVHRLPTELKGHRMVCSLPTVAAVLFGISLVLIALTLPASRANCGRTRSDPFIEKLYCNALIQALATKD